MPTHEENNVRQWSRPPSQNLTGEQRVLALLKHPLGERVWNNPFQDGKFTVQDYWSARERMEHHYSRGWPSQKSVVARMLVRSGLTSDQIPEAIEKEARWSRSDPLSLLELHTALTEEFNIPKTDGLQVLQWLYPAREGSLSGVWEHFSTQLDTLAQALVVHDGSPEAQQKYLSSFQTAVGPYPLPEAEPASDEEDEPRGAFPMRRGKYRNRDRIHRVDYEWGMHGTGVVLVNELPKVDDTQLVEWFHQRHDVYALACMAVKERLPVSTLLHRLLNPAPGPYPDPSARKGYQRESNTAVLHRIETQQAIAQVLSLYNPAELKDELQSFTAHNPEVFQKLQELFPFDMENLSPWWSWNILLHQYGLLNPETPAFEQAMREIQTKLDEKPALPTSGLTSYLRKEAMTPAWSAFASLNSTLATLAGVQFFHNASRHAKSSEMWDGIRSIDLGFLQKARMAPHFMGPSFLDSHYGMSQGVSSLTQAAMVLPQFNTEDQAAIAPLVAYRFGASNVQGFSPSTFRSIWKEQNPEHFKAVIPKPYQANGDTYLLYALTRQNADNLLHMLDSLDLRHNRSAYLEAVTTWTRTALQLPPEHAVAEFSTALENFSS